MTTIACDGSKKGALYHHLLCIPGLFATNEADQSY